MNFFRFPRRWEQWLKALIAATISGGANSVVAALGPPITNALGITVNTPPITPDQIKSIFIGGAWIGMMFYLAKSPVPPDSTGDTERFTRDQTDKKT